MIDLPQLAMGVALSTLVAAAALATRTLTAGGAVAAILVGAVTWGMGGSTWGLLLFVFFATSSMLSDWRSGSKAGVGLEFAKGGPRDLTQVLANGGVGALLALAHVAYPDKGLLAAFVGAMAAVTADTWATEIGLLSSVPPRLITSGKPVPPGSSGGVTVLGSAAAAAAGIFIGLAATTFVALQSYVMYGVLDLSGAPLALVAPVAGVASAAVDSWLGATAQGMFHCPTCDAETERRVHHCGQSTQLTRGWRVLTNDGVNLLSSIVGAALAWALTALVWG